MIPPEPNPPKLALDVLHPTPRLLRRLAQHHGEEVIRDGLHGLEHHRAAVGADLFEPWGFGPGADRDLARGKKEVD